MKKWRVVTNWVVNGNASGLRADADQPLPSPSNVARKSYLSRDLHTLLKSTNGAVTKVECTSSLRWRRWVLHTGIKL